MKDKTMNRRQFLRGAGGFTLALPFLGSLIPSKAFAGEFPYAQNPRFVCMATNHGGLWNSHMYPAESTYPDRMEVYSGHDMYYGALQRSESGNDASISPVLTGPASLLSQDVVDKMFLMRGLDIMFYINHHTGGYLGNFARFDTEDTEPLGYRPTIDQVMAWSPNFYPDINNIRERSFHVGRLISWGWTNPGERTGDVIDMPEEQSSLDLFNRTFIPDMGPTIDPRTPVVDRILESYNSLRYGAFGDGRRISAQDRQRLDDHMDRMSELQRRLSVSIEPPPSCGEIPTPSDEAHIYDDGVTYLSRDVEDGIRHFQLWNDVVVAAFICGTSRIATVHVDAQLHIDERDWHQDVAHKAHLEGADPENPNDPAPQGVMLEAQNTFFRNIYLDLVNKLNVEEADGVTYLENSLVTWNQESGNTTHNSDSMPIVCAGSAAGYFNTGMIYDYRNRNSNALTPEWEDPTPDTQKHPGIPYNRWLANVLQSMNVTPEEYEWEGERGYAVQRRDSEEAYPDHLFDDLSDPLPLATNS